MDITHGSVITGDSLTILDDLPENEFHAVVTDPPYNYEGGFMQREWDDVGSGEEYRNWCATWAEKCKRVLKPGGHIISFSGEITHHKLMSGFEDADFELRHTIPWIYANGLPKGPKLSTWLDGEDAEQWGDWRGMLKPAIEPVILARSPLGERSATRNQVEYGVGNLNVEACRIPPADESEAWDGDDDFNEADGTALEGSVNGEPNTQNSGLGTDGRFPANIVLGPIMAELMDLQSGERDGCSPHVVDDSGSRNVLGEGGFDEMDERTEGYDDSGGASRFFFCSKAQKQERTHGGDVENDHETVKPIDLMEWLIKLVTADDQKVLDPFAGSGTTILAAENVGRKAVGIEQDEAYVSIAEDRIEAHGLLS